MMKENNSIVGTRVGIFDILYECDFKANDGHKLYHVRCVMCGWETNMLKSDIKRTKNCTHIGINGHYKVNYLWKNKRLAKIFRGMKDRCYNANDKNYVWYGAKGIKICNEWFNNPKLFEEWSFSNGYSDNMTIDRIEENKDYSPENCQWVELKDNAKYKSTTSYLYVNGEVHTGREWSKKLGFGVNLINTYARRYGKENTEEFIRRYLKNPNFRPDNQSKSYYDLYMNTL